jgi:sec-independent protein translocase protein TatA
MGIGTTQLLIIFAIILLLFGGKRLRSLGSDLGEALRGFRKSVKDEDQDNGGDSEPPKGLGSSESKQQSADSERDHEKR